MPSCIPDSAANVKIAHDVDSNEVWIRFEIDAASAGILRAQVKQTGWSQVHDGVESPPFTFGDWNEVVGGTLVYTPPTSSLYFTYGARNEWHGVLQNDGRCWIALNTAA